jgi:peroxiredoxin family protein
MPEGLQRLDIVVFDGRYDRVVYALAMAAAAAASNRPASMFFTGKAVRALAAGGWKRLAVDPADGPDAESVDRARQARGVAGWDTLAEAVSALGIPVMACEMALAADGMAAVPLEALPAKRTGLVGFYAQATGQIVFI